MKRIFAFVHKDGSVNYMRGPSTLTVEHPETGVYKIRYNVKFDSFPHPIVTLYDDNTAANAVLNGGGRNGTTILTGYAGQQNRSDIGFFISVFG